MPLNRNTKKAICKDYGLSQWRGGRVLSWTDPRANSPTISSYDSISNLTACYSVRKVISTYSGDCVRLRRDSDQAESDFGFSGGDLDTSAISTWLGAANGFLVTWYDQGTNGYDATQSTAAYQPAYVASGINSKPTFDFDGTNDFLSCNGMATTFAGTNKPLTVIATGSCDITSGYSNLFTCTSSTDSDPVVLAYRAAITDGDIEWVWQDDLGNLDYYSAGHLPVTDDAEQLYGMVFTGERFSSSIDRTVLWHNEDAPYADNQTTFDRASIGADYRVAAINNTWNGYISELVIYEAAITSAGRRQVEDYQNDYFSLLTPTTYTVDNAADFQVTPTYEASGEVVHPDIIDMYVRFSGRKWNNYRYWLGITPFPGSQATYERPSILVSNDGDNWVVPNGVTNPIRDATKPDAELAMSLDGKTLFLYYLNAAVDTNEIIEEQHSNDGIRWTTFSQILDTDADYVASPTIVYDGSQYVLWTVNISPSPNVVNKRTAPSPTGPWTAIGAITVNGRLAGLDIWHIKFYYHNGMYYGVFCLGKINTTIENTTLWWGTSSDGDTWNLEKYPILNPSTDDWDNWDIYRSTLSPTKNGWGVWYTAVSRDSVWHLGRVALDNN